MLISLFLTIRHRFILRDRAERQVTNFVAMHRRFNNEFRQVQRTRFINDVLAGIFFVSSGATTSKVVDFTMSSFVTIVNISLRAIFVRQRITIVGARPIITQRVRFVPSLYRRRAFTLFCITGGAKGAISVRNNEFIAYGARGGNSVNIITFAHRQR